MPEALSIGSHSAPILTGCLYFPCNMPQVDVNLTRYWCFPSLLEVFLLGRKVSFPSWLMDGFPMFLAPAISPDPTAACSTHRNLMKPQMCSRHLSGEDGSLKSGVFSADKSSFSRSEP